MQLVLNQYVRNTADKVLTPLLKENGCGDLKPQLNSWLFNFAKTTPDKDEWSRLTNYNIDGLLGSQQRTTLPINGRLKLSENTISLELYMKFLKLKVITTTDINNVMKTYKQKSQEIIADLNQKEIDTGTHQDKTHYLEELEHNMLMLEATEEPTQEEYYSCTLPIGTCTRNTLTNRAQKVILEIGVNIQDLKFKMANNNFKLIKNNRGTLTYIVEDRYKQMVKIIAKKNKEIKVNGPNKTVGT